MAPASYHGSPNAVCVMDASGEVGLALVRRLLRRGYTVHAASRGRGEELKVKGLSGGEARRLKVFRSDPLDYHTVLDAVRGCSGLFYNFEPPAGDLSPPYDEYVVEEEVRAAHNVVEACAQTETMEKVVYGSSVTAVVWNGTRASASAEELDERSWSDPNFCRKLKLWHALGKTLAEKTAWALAMDRDVSMVSINAGLLTGSELGVADPYLRGAAEMYEDGVLATVDAEFLADAHVCAYEDVSAYGRYLCFTHPVCRGEDAARLARTLEPSAPSDGDAGGIVKQRINNGKLMELMADFDGGLVIEDDMEFLS